MAETKIEWCSTRLPDGRVLPGYTFNAWIGCTKVSPECNFCYADRDMGANSRFALAQWGSGQPRHLTADSTWAKLSAWNNHAVRLGVPLKVFCASLSDVFDAEVPTVWRDRLWNAISQCHSLRFLLLTKRPQNIVSMLPPTWPWPHVALGISVGNQRTADLRGPLLAAIPAAMRFISYEPAIGPVDFEKAYWLSAYDWVISGGESGAIHEDVRPSHTQWHRDCRDVCAKRGIAYLFKQWGEYLPIDQAGWDVMEKDIDLPFARKSVFVDPGDTGDIFTSMLALRVGKKLAGHRLDGKEHLASPEWATRIIPTENPLGL